MYLCKLRIIDRSAAVWNQTLTGVFQMLVVLVHLFLKNCYYHCHTKKIFIIVCRLLMIRHHADMFCIPCLLFTRLD